MQEETRKARETQAEDIRANTDTQCAPGVGPLVTHMSHALRLYPTKDSMDIVGPCLCAMISIGSGIFKRGVAARDAKRCSMKRLCGTECLEEGILLEIED